MKKFILYSIFFFSSSFLLGQISYSKYVNPMIGTGGTGHTFPGATAPFGMVQLSPDTKIDGSWEGCSGYSYVDTLIYGFSHTHLSGTGCSDYGDIMLMPFMGGASTDSKVYSSTFSHKDEVAKAGFYKVKLQKNDIQVALTASTRVGFHEYTFPTAGEAQIVLDLNHRDKLLEGEVYVIDNKTVEVFRRSEAWAKDQYCYARIEFDKPFTIGNVRCNGSKDAKTFKGTELALCFSRKVTKGEKVKVKVSLSPTGREGARLNMSEIKHWDFEKTKAEVQKLWDKELSKIEVKSKDANKLAIFYTAMYHLMIQPNIAMDIDHKYRGRDNKIHTAVGFDYYSVFSLWDTYRAAHPLLAVIDKKRTSHFIQTFLTQYQQGGRLPVWELASYETDCMIGYHSVSVMADAMAKGITGFDYNLAFEAAKHSAMLDHLGLKAYKKNGFITIDDEHESVSKTLEYAYDDWCIASMAKMLNKPEDFKIFSERAASWMNLYDEKSGFMRPRKNGNWALPFEPREVNNHFTEGNSWQYSFYVPHQLDALIQAHGGKDNFERKLDELFKADNQTTGRLQVDITGLIGQYAHGNEPSHHIIWLYSKIGKPEKSQKLVKYVLDSFYINEPDGLIGNEDCGQMSAWYILASMGIYPVCPGEAEWTTIKPYFEEVKIHLENGKTEIINAFTSPEKLKYIGLPIAQKSKENISLPELISAPLIQTAGKSFLDSTKVTLESFPPQNHIFYKTSIDTTLRKYEKPFFIQESCEIISYAKTKNRKNSPVSSARFYKKPNNYTIEIKSKCNPQYNAGGPDGLLDGILGELNWRTGEWQGYQSQDFEAVIDLQTVKNTSQVSTRFLQDTRSWILMPTMVEIYTSIDNQEYKLDKTLKNTIKPENYEIMIETFDATFEQTNARYIKIKAYNFGKLPTWHQAFPYNGDAFLFLDEITIK